MNPETEKRILAAIEDLDEDARAKANTALRECNITSPDDPILGLLTVLRLRAQQGQQNTPAGVLSRMGDRFDGLVWRLERWKWRNLILSWLLFFGLGSGLCCGAMAYLAVNEPDQLRGWLRLPTQIEYRTVSDGRVLKLQRNDVTWNVLDEPDYVAIIVGGFANPTLQACGTNWAVVFRRMP